MDAAGTIQVAGRRLAIRNLDRVVFPQTGTTKAELLDYYVRIADAMLPHLRDRQLHMHRYPEGVEGPRFWQKGCPEHRPEWVPTVPVWMLGLVSITMVSVLDALHAPQSIVRGLIVGVPVAYWQIDTRLSQRAPR